MSVTETARPAKATSASIAPPPAGHTGTLNGHVTDDAHKSVAIEGQDSPQAICVPTPMPLAPAGTQTAQPATRQTAPIGASLAGHQDDRGHSRIDIHTSLAPAPTLPGAHTGNDAQYGLGTREQAPPAAKASSASIRCAPLADPLLALAADVLSDLEKVRIANENRLRQLTRSEEDSDGETRGFGLDESHPDVARLAALVDMLGEAEHKATLNLGRLMRKHPLGPWLAAQKGIGEKQGARLLAAIGDPYIRPEIVREDGTVEPSRPRTVSELRAYCGYGEDKASPGTIQKRARGQKANWSAAAKMRAFLVAESCIKQSGTPYRAKYDTTREKYAEAVHAAECVRCGPKGKPAQPGSPLSAGHQHARALRAVAKEVLRDLWREARRLHEAPSAAMPRTAPMVFSPLTDTTQDGNTP